MGKDVRVACCLCHSAEIDMPKKHFVISSITSHAVCEACIEEAVIAIRTRKAVEKNEYGIL